MRQYIFHSCTRQILGDLHTPVSVYLKVRDIYPESALLEASDFHSAENSQSFIGLCPIASFGVNDGIATIKTPDNTELQTNVSNAADISTLLQEFMDKLKVENTVGACGLFGYTAFNSVRYFEQIPVKNTHAADNG